METRKPFGGLQNAPDDRVKRIAKETIKEVITGFLWNALGFSIVVIASMSIGYRLANL